MPAGYQVIGNNGSIQIDETYANLALRYQGTATADTFVGLTGSTMYKASVVVSADAPLIAWRSTDQPISFMASIVSGGTRTFVFWGPQNASFSYYVFDKPQPGGTGGLEVLDAAGNRTFWYGYKYMRIVNAMSGADYASAMGDHTFTAGRSYAVCQAVPSRIYEDTYIQDPDSGDWEHETNRWALATKSIANGINLDEVVHQQLFAVSGPGSNVIIERKKYSLLVVDVTDF